MLKTTKNDALVISQKINDIFCVDPTINDTINEHQKYSDNK